MNIERTTKPHRITPRGIAETTLSGRRFAGAVTAGAVALALVLGAALPAKADKKDDLAKALVAALVAGVLANELADKPKHDSRREPVKSKWVPAICAITIDGAKQSVTLYPESCLRQEGFDYRLPRNCANSAHIFGRSDRVYSAQCLHESGFRVSGK
jgi:hypothetical protein